MATARLAIVLLVLGTVLLLVVQNTAPALPLVFLGARTLALPLGVWLGLAIALGALTTVGLILVLPFTRPGGRSGRSPAYKYKAQPFYEPTHPDATGASATSADAASQSSFRSGRRDRPTGEWQAWTDLKSPNQWNDWDALSQAHQQSQAPPSRSAASQTATATSFWPPNWFGDRQAAQKQQIDQSLEELTQDWGDMENRAYTAPGVSPVDDSLDDINQGWDNHPAPPPPTLKPPRVLNGFTEMGRFIPTAIAKGTASARPITFMPLLMIKVPPPMGKAPLMSMDQAIVTTMLPPTPPLPPSIRID